MRLPRSLQWRIALAYTALIVVSMAAASIYIFIFVRGTYMSDLELRLEHEVGLLGQTAERYFRGRITLDELRAENERAGAVIDARVTTINADGAVLADTWEDPQRMGNHGRRPEVREALATGLGRNTRFTTIVDQEVLYTAVPVHVDGALAGIARVAVTTSQVQSNLNDIIAAVALSGLVVTVLSVALGYFVARRTARSVRSVTEGARRLAQGDLGQRVYAPSGDETRELADTFNSMAATLTTTFQELATERNRLSAILETMADGVVMIGPDSEVVLMNRVAQGLLDVGTSDPVGRRYIELVRDYDLLSLVSRAFETRQPGFEEVAHSSGKLLSAVAIPLVEAGSTAGVLLTLHDLTRVRQLDTTRREFVSNVSHELRSPLASVRAMVETLEGGALRDQEVALDFLGRIEGDIQRMTTLVDELLELSRLESGQMPIHLAPLSVSEVAGGIVARFKGPAAAAGVKMGMDFPPDLPYVMAEAGKLDQILTNLLENALRFTPEGGSVDVSASTVERWVKLTVSDTGVGISSEHLPHVFERFYKVDRARRDSGAGLGLAIVKHIVHAYGGEVGVRSEEGVGSTFTFTVPHASREA
jgi:two-component system phosphate regulon sensor histidine kinase PhoR